jgi:hypothetical protein
MANPADLSKAILSYKQFQIMVAVTMAYPQGMQASRLDPTIGDLVDLGMIQQKGDRWFPTEAGVNHIMPSKFQKSGINIGTR